MESLTKIEISFSNPGHRERHESLMEALILIMKESKIFE